MVTLRRSELQTPTPGRLGLSEAEIERRSLQAAGASIVANALRAMVADARQSRDDPAGPSLSSRNAETLILLNILAGREAPVGALSGPIR